ncbi:MAG: hypothetical protein IKW38_00485 [Kiritimatiellae bacterium]|nr:hypothetical protein [Kiritimatiellia bacterium]
MKTAVTLCSLLLTLPLFAADSLTINKKPLETPITDEATLSIEGTPTVQSGAVTVLSADIVFTIPSESPDYEAVKGEKLALVADTDGTILIADAAQNEGAGGWKVTNVKTDGVAPIAVYAEGQLKGDVLVFAVKLNDDNTSYEVKAPDTGATLAAVQTVGEGTVSNLSIALVDTTILPGSASEPQSPELIEHYVTWLNESTKGGAMTGTDVSSEALADAFAMNTSGTPALEIVAIDPINRKVTLKGSTTTNEGTTDVSLSSIYGTIYLSWTDALNGQVTVSKVEASTVDPNDANAIVVDFPEGAKFIKAAVSLKAPTETSL